ncbi:MAG TPA: EAL domain-containing protein [Candidatus Saccharimonadales bacterium]|nr:EAL domain-containing protein [Candidatus Saccharimonadales bacterium]
MQVRTPLTAEGVAPGQALRLTTLRAAAPAIALGLIVIAIVVLLALRALATGSKDAVGSAAILLAYAVVAAGIGLMVVALVRDEASRQALRRLYEAARLDALRDPLTGLGNHRAFHEEFRRQLEIAARYRVPLALLLIDLDDFKSVNDAAGHASGDALLLEMRRLMMGTLRRADLAFRIGGDEFAVLMPHTDAEDALVVARRLLAAALEFRASSGFSAAFSFSGGISAYPASARDQRRLHAQADAALYWSKAHGRTMIERYDPDRHRNLSVLGTRLELSEGVAGAIERRALRPVFQPIVDVDSGRILGYEGLVRPLPDSGFADAGILFEAAEVSGRQVELDWTCIEVVLGRAGLLPPDCILSVNMSPRTLEAPEFSLAELLRRLVRHGLPPERLVIELTERGAISDLTRLRDHLEACQRVGIRAAADDLGSGNAGIRLLSEIQFDIVKIDLSLVQAGPHRETSLSVLRSMTELARGNGAWVIAEGIETPEQLRMVRNLGIAAAQGYLLGPPGDAMAGGSIDLAPLLVQDDWLRRLARSPEAPRRIPRASHSGT